MAYSYILAKTVSKAFKVRINLPLIFLLSVLPDIDLLIPGLKHRSILHSIIIQTIAFIPFFLYFKKHTVPYYAALASHSLLGDYIAGGGIQLLWPLTTKVYGLTAPMLGLTAVALELSGFIAAAVLMTLSRDVLALLKTRKENLLLSLSCVALLASVVLSWKNSASVSLFIVHLALFAAFAASVLISLRSLVLNRFQLPSHQS